MLEGKWRLLDMCNSWFHLSLFLKCLENPHLTGCQISRKAHMFCDGFNTFNKAHVWWSWMSKPAWNWHVTVAVWCLDSSFTSILSALPFRERALTGPSHKILTKMFFYLDHRVCPEQTAIIPVLRLQKVYYVDIFVQYRPSMLTLGSIRRSSQVQERSHITQSSSRCLPKA